MLISRAVVAIFASAVLGVAQTNETDQEYFRNLELFWSYGRSPPVYPSPNATGLGDWQDAITKARSMVAQMTTAEKENVTVGYQLTTNGCNGNTGSVPRLGFPGICLGNAENGVGGGEGINAYPAAIHLGASWSKQLAFDRALHMGREFKRKGVNVILGPTIGPLGRVPKGGRNWETPSVDPYLTGILTYDTIVGLQESVMANLKHIVGNEQETSRKPPRYIEGTHNASLSSNIDDKTMHEVYLWPFMDSLRAGAASVMASYQRINNSEAFHNSKVLNGLLKTELGFQGFVVSDWFAHHSGLSSAEAGLDMVMPVAPLWSDGNLTMMVQNGSLPKSRLDDMAVRILAPWYRFAAFENPGFGIPQNYTQPHEFIDARSSDSKHTIFQGAVEGHVLVKNVNKALPLKSPKFISIFGYDAAAQFHNTHEHPGFNAWKSGLGAARQFLNGTVFTTGLLDYLFASSMDQRTTGPEVALNGTLITGGGSGAAAAGIIDAPLDAFKRQAFEDDTYLLWDTQSHAPVVNQASEACLVFINAVASEGWDRLNLTDSYSDSIVTTVAGQCNNTMVVVHAAGIRLVDSFIEHPNITAVILGHLPGQDSGRALVELMYGRQSFSGRLPYAVAKQESDYGALLDPDFPSDETPYYPQSNFTEGVYIDYRHFDQYNITPRFEFGFGLTYTNFNYTDLQVEIDQQAASSRLPPNPDVLLQGGVDSLWDEIGRVRCSVTNVGDVEAKEVAQLYLGIPGGAAKVLRGFEKQLIRPGRTAEIVFPLTRRDLSSWNVVEQQWELQRGVYNVFVGKSVRDLPLSDSFEIED